MTEVKEIDAQTAKRWIDAGDAILIDVREKEEKEREAISGSKWIPLAALTIDKLLPFSGKKIIFHCRSGKRSYSACIKMGEKSPNLDLYNLQGGILAWKESGCRTQEGVRSFSLEQQTDIAIGSGILLAILLGAFAHPIFYGIAGAFSIGIILRGITGMCRLHAFLAKMPWNQK